MRKFILFLQGPVGPVGHPGQPGIPGVKVLLFLLFDSERCFFLQTVKGLGHAVLGSFSTD